VADGAADRRQQHVVDGRVVRMGDVLDLSERQLRAPGHAPADARIALDRRGRVGGRQHQPEQRYAIAGDRARDPRHVGWRSDDARALSDRYGAHVARRAEHMEARTDQSSESTSRSKASLDLHTGGHSCVRLGVGQGQHHAGERDPIGDAMVDAGDHCGC
jgi:hypothetical protein